MKRRNFHISHSAVGALLWVAIEGILLWLLLHSSVSENIACWLILAFALFGGVANIVVATEVIEDVRNPRHMLVLLSAVVAVFVAFFAFQYWYLLLVLPNSFQGLNINLVDLLLHSTMIFVFNPIYLPTTTVARILLLINTFTSLGLVLFILQNVWQIRAKV